MNTEASFRFKAASIICIALMNAHVACAQTWLKPINLSISPEFIMSMTETNKNNYGSIETRHANENIRLLANFRRWETQCDSECKITLFNEETPMEILGDKVNAIDNPILNSAYQILMIPAKIAGMGNQVGDTASELLLGHPNYANQPVIPPDMGIPADPAPKIESYHDQMEDEFHAMLGNPTQ